MTDRYKPVLQVSAGTVEEANLLLEAGADELNVGDAAFGLRMPGPMSREDIGRTIEMAHARGARVIVSVHNIIDNDQLEEMNVYLRQLAEMGADGIVFGDPAVLIAAKEHAPAIKLIWSAEMTSTNYATANYWARKGVSRIVLARELNLEQILEFKRNCAAEVQVQVHGATNIYHSKRKLVTSYRQHMQDDHGEAGMRSGLVLMEQEREGQQYPIYEDASGTHIMSYDDICVLDALDEVLAGGIDALRIEGLLKSPEYNGTVTAAYRKAIDVWLKDPENYRFDSELLDSIKRVQDPSRELTYGFFFKEQVY